MKDPMEKKVNRLVFQMIDDGGIGNSVFDFANDEGYRSAINKVEAWRDAIEEMLEASNDTKHPMAVVLLEIRKRITLYLANLTIQAGE